MGRRTVTLVGGQEEFAYGALQLGFELGRIGPRALRAGCQKAADHKAIDRFHRVGRWDAQQADLAAGVAEPVPQRPRAAGGGVDHRHFVAIRAGKDKVHQPVLAGIHTGDKRAPRRGADGRQGGSQLAPGPSLHQSLEIGQLAIFDPGAEQVPGHAIEADNQYLHPMYPRPRSRSRISCSPSALYSMASAASWAARSTVVRGKAAIYSSSKAAVKT